MKVLAKFNFNDDYKIFTLLEKDEWDLIDAKVLYKTEPITLRLLDQNFEFTCKELNEAISAVEITDHTCYLLQASLSDLMDQSKVFEQLKNIAESGKNELIEEPEETSLEGLDDEIEATVEGEQ